MRAIRGNSGASGGVSGEHITHVPTYIVCLVCMNEYTYCTMYSVQYMYIEEEEVYRCGSIVGTVTISVSAIMLENINNVFM